MSNNDTPAPCIVDGCYAWATKRSRCGEHQLPSFYRNERSERLPRDWQYRRRMVFQRDNGICHICGEPGADRIDHINQSMEDDHSLENLAPVHDLAPPHCHRYKTSVEGNQAKKLYSNTGRRFRAEDLPF